MKPLHDTLNELEKPLKLKKNTNQMTHYRGVARISVEGFP